jgi:chromosome segregation ATPase
MDDQQRQTMNRAAQQFTDALVAAYRAASDNTAAAQQLGAQQIEYFFDAVMGNLRAQAGGTSQMAQQLAGQQRLAQQTTRDLARVSTDNYMDFLDSMFSFYQGGTSRSQRRAEEAQRRIEEAEARAERAEARAEQAEARAGEAERAKSEAESRTEEAKRGASAAKRRATEAEKRAREAESRTEEAEGGAEEAERRALDAEGRAEEAERGRSEAERRAGDEEGDTRADAASRPRNQWVRTSGRSKVRGRNTRARNRSSGRRR